MPSILLAPLNCQHALPCLFACSDEARKGQCDRNWRCHPTNRQPQLNNNSESELASSSLPVESWNYCRPGCERPRARGSSWAMPDSWSKETTRFSKPLGFEVTYHAATGHKYTPQLCYKLHEFKSYIPRTGARWLNQCINEYFKRLGIIQISTVS